MAEQKIIETIDSDGLIHLSNILDKDTGSNITLKQVLLYYDGTPITDAKTVASEGVYRKYKGNYFIKALGDKAAFLIKNSVAELRAITSKEILLLRMGHYSGVELTGYYIKGDTPSPIIYEISDTNLSDNDGNILQTTFGVKLEYKFNQVVNSSYFGNSYNKLCEYVNSNDSVTSLNFDKDIAGNFSSPIITIYRNNLSLNFNDKLISNISASETELLMIGGNNIQVNDVNLSAPLYLGRTPLAVLLYGNTIKFNRGSIKDSIKAVELAARNLSNQPADLSNITFNLLKVSNVVDGIYIGQSTFEQRGDITNVIIDGCDLYGGKGTDEDSGGDGIKTTRNCTNIRVTNNKIDNFKRDAIDLYVSGDRVIITNNSLTRSGVKAIDIKSEIDVYPPEDFGIDGIDINISSNEILFNQEGISIDRSLTNPISYNKQISINNNNISYNKDLGVFLCGQYVDIRNNFFVGNGKETERNDYSVIRLGNDELIRIAKNNGISNNTFINNGKNLSDANYAIRVSRYSEGNSIFENKIFNEEDLDNPVQTGGIYVNTPSKSAIYNNHIDVINMPYTIIDGALVDTKNKTSVNVDITIEGDTFIKKADFASYIQGVVVTSTQDLPVDADNNIIVTITRIRGGIETTITFYNQGTKGLLKFSGLPMVVSEEDSIVNENDIHVARVFRMGNSLATKPLNVSISYF